MGEGYVGFVPQRQSTVGTAGQDASGHIYQDMGQDGLSNSANPNTLVGRDAYGFNLNYFNNDYKPITALTASQHPFATFTMPLPADPANSKLTGAALYNGNIASMMLNMPKLGKPILYGYAYDQLNRIVRMDAFQGSMGSNNSLTPVRMNGDYHEAVTYDPNGNIQTYLRNGTTQNSLPLTMDNLSYEYIANTNKLKRVTDVVSSTNYTDDIDNQADADNYVYDEIGNLVQDKAEGLDNIEWTVYGKISKITKVKGGITTVIDYTYDASGNRISKKVTESSVSKTTYYVRDASGNVMSIYQLGETALNGGDLSQVELHLYGSSRLGVYNLSTDVQCVSSSTDITNFIRGNKFFELSNHLGNVLATISDRKIEVDNDANGQVDYYLPDVITANDYYPFGMLMPGRQVYLDTTTRNVGNTSTAAVPIDTTVVMLYRHSFNDTPSTHPYITAPVVLNSNLSSSSWTNDRSTWTSFAGVTGQAIAFTDTRPDTAIITLNVNIASGKKATIKSFSFYHRGCPTGYIHWKMYINGINVGDSISGNVLDSTGTRQVTNPVADLTGNITVVLKLYGHDLAGIEQGTFRMDDFILNGYVNDNGAGSTTGAQYANNGSYRYGFNGKENDNEVKGEGNQQDYGMRIYDPRLGRFLSVDPLTKSYPYYTPYSFAGNMPIEAIDLDGLEEYIVIDDHFRDGTLKSTTILYTQSKIDATTKVNIKARALHDGNADGSYIAEGQKVLRISQQGGRDISKTPDKNLTKRELLILKQYSRDDKPVIKEDNLWQIDYKNKSYQNNPEEIIRNTSTMVDRNAVINYNHLTSNTIPDLPSITVSDFNNNGDIDLSTNSNFKLLFDRQLNSLANEGNIGNVQITLNIFNNPTEGNTNEMRTYVEKAKEKISSQLKNYVSQKLGTGVNKISITINNDVGTPSKGNTIIQTK